MHRGSDGPSASSKSAYLPSTSTCLSVLFSRCDGEKATEAPTVVTFCDAETEAGCVWRPRNVTEVAGILVEMCFLGLAAGCLLMEEPF